MQRARLAFLAPFVLLAFLAVIRPYADGQQPTASETELARGSALLDEGRPAEAWAAFEKAAALAGAPCGACALGMATAANRGAAGDAVAAGRRAVQLLAGDPLEAAAHSQLAIALYRRDASRKDLEEAADHFRQVVVLTGGESRMARMNLGRVLLRLGRRKEGVAELEEFLKLVPSGPDADKARAMIADPGALDAKRKVAFRFTGLDGREITSDGLRGKVVLLDFWATWCEPCNAALPHLRRLARDLARKPFVLVSVAADEDEAVVKSRVAKERMTWPQAWDPNVKVGRAIFDVTSLPAYFVLGADGTVAFAGRGWAEGQERTIRAAVESALANARTRPPG